VVGLNNGLISREGTALIVIDVQEKLFPHIYGRGDVVRNICRLIRFAKIVGMPIILTEQYPKGLGKTIPEIKELTPGIKPIEKIEFSCFRTPIFEDALRRLNVKTLIIVGIETHICVSQTAIEGLSRGYKVCVIGDAVSSRRLEDKIIGIERMRQSGVIISSTEMVIYEILGRAGTPEFKEVLKLVK